MLSQVVELIEDKIQKNIDKVIHDWKEEGIVVEKARWGRSVILKGKIKIELNKDGSQTLYDTPIGFPIKCFIPLVGVWPLISNIVFAKSLNEVAIPLPKFSASTSTSLSTTVITASTISSIWMKSLTWVPSPQISNSSTLRLILSIKEGNG